MLQSLGLVGTIAEGDAGPEDPESGGSEDEEVGPGRICCLGRGRAGPGWISLGRGRGRCCPGRPSRGRCSSVLPQELRRAPGPRRRGPTGGDFSAAFVFGEAEAGGEGAWAAALRQLRGKVRPGAETGAAVPEATVPHALPGASYSSSFVVFCLESSYDAGREDRESETEKEVPGQGLPLSLLERLVQVWPSTVLSLEAQTLKAF